MASLQRNTARGLPVAKTTLKRLETVLPANNVHVARALLKVDVSISNIMKVAGVGTACESELTRRVFEDESTKYSEIEIPYGKVTTNAYVCGKK